MKVFDIGDRVVTAWKQRVGTVVGFKGDMYEVRMDDGVTVLMHENFLERPEDTPEKKKKTSTAKSDGGPSSYYDFDPGWNTFNDFMEAKASLQWKEYSLHLKDIMKAGCRFGVKDGTTDAYDARKMVYSSLRLLGMIEGHNAMREELEKLLKDKQFERRN